MNFEDLIKKVMAENGDVDLLDWAVKIARVLNKEIRLLKPGMVQNEVRLLVDTYYQLQEFRKAVNNQKRSIVQGVDEATPSVLIWLSTMFTMMEKNVKGALTEYSENQAIGRWAESIRGIGPVISAGLLAHIDMNRAKTPGHIWSYAGLDPRQKWIKKEEAKKIIDSIDGKITPDSIIPICNEHHLNANNVWKFASHKKDGSERKVTKENLASAIARRPWNASFRTLCWKIGDSFMKNHNKSDDIYGHIYYARKQEEVKKNESGKFADQAAAVLKGCPSHKQADTYKKGKLSDSHVDSRARRYAVKIFLSHWWEVAYRLTFNKDPEFVPYPIAHLNHIHKIEVPNLPPIPEPDDELEDKGPDDELEDMERPEEEEE